MLISLLVLVSCIDVYKRVIPNTLNLLIFIVTLTLATFADDTNWSEVSARFLVLSIPLITVYIGGFVGAGDVKLIFALQPVIPSSALISFAIYTVFLGALLAMMILIYIAKAPAAHHRTVPYGVAISGAIFILAAQGKLLI